LKLSLEMKIPETTYESISAANEANMFTLMSPGRYYIWKLRRK